MLLPANVQGATAGYDYVYGLISARMVDCTTTFTGSQCEAAVAAAV